MTFENQPLTLGRFDVAERQLNQAISLFFSGGDPISVHTLAEAALQILYDIRSGFGGRSLLRDDARIRPEKRKEWLAMLSSSRNFFKHADRDRDDKHEFREEFNHFSIADGVNMLLTAKRVWTPETIVFLQWFIVNYPDVLVENNPLLPAFTAYAKMVPTDKNLRLQLSSRAIDEMRSSRLRVPGISLEMGLPE